MKQQVLNQAVFSQYFANHYPSHPIEANIKSGISEKSTSSENQDQHQNYQNFPRIESEVRSGNDYTFEANPQNSKYKIQLCRNFMSFGYCPYGDRCQYAHGREQLRYTNGMLCFEVQCNPQVLTTNQKYKTKQCRQFFRKGYCPYGETCNYLHKELKNKPIKQIKQLEKKRKDSDDGFRQIILMSRPESRILKFLKSENGTSL